jgi:hypothetical protein
LLAVAVIASGFVIGAALGACSIPLLALFALEEATVMTLGAGSMLMTGLIGAKVSDKICDVIIETSEN